MCGIPLPPPDDITADRRKRLSFEQVLTHIGGYGNLITQEGREEIIRNIKHYLWKYPDGHCYCTACGADVGDLRAPHKREIACPNCRQAAEFRHVARGHSKIFDEFDHRYWRKSLIDPETVILTITQIWRDSRVERPECSEARIKPTAVYVFRAGSPATVYKNHYWRNDRDVPACWSLQNDVKPENTYGGRLVEALESAQQMREALEGTRVGRTYAAVFGNVTYTDMRLVACCAARPWLEYLAKCGQRRLATELAACRTVPKDVVAKPKADNPRALLGLTEGQWYEIRKNGMQLTMNDLEIMRAMVRMGYKAPKLSEAHALGLYSHEIGCVSPCKYSEDSIDALTRACPDTLRRQIFRAAIRENWRRRNDRRDYYKALIFLHEDMTDSALLLPKDFMGMHDRYTLRAAQIQKKEAAQLQRARELAFRPELQKLQALYCFTACGLTLRPFETSDEIHNEGSALKICIGGYANDYFAGKNIICCLRRAEEPDEPFHAVEFSLRDGHVVQDRGFRNKSTINEPPGTRRQIQLFWAAFDKAKKRRRKTV